MSVSPPPLKRKRLSDAAMTTRTPKDLLSLYSWNVNGVEPLLQTSIKAYFSSAEYSSSSFHSTPLRDFLRRHCWPALCFLQEVKIRPNDASTMRAIQRAVTLGEGGSPEYEVHFCLPSDKNNVRGFGGKVYGVCSLIRKDFAMKSVDRVRSVDWDQEGRFLVVETKATERMPKLAIFNVYLVNGTDNPYRDPSTGDVLGSRHDRKLQVHKLLQSECRRLEQEGFGVIIAGDINVARSPLDGHPKLRVFPHQHVVNRMDFEKRFFGEINDSKATTHTTASATEDEIEKETSLGMHDTFRALHGRKKGYTYYPRHVAFGTSCDRVDMIIGSDSVVRCCTTAGMLEDPLERGPSDHVPIYAEFDFQQDNSKPPG